MIGVNLRGEMTSAMKKEESFVHFTLIDKLAETMRLSSSEVGFDLFFCIEIWISFFSHFCALIFLQEMHILREAVFPYLLCAAAREGNVESLSKLRDAVSWTTLTLFSVVGADCASFCFPFREPISSWVTTTVVLHCTSPAANATSQPCATCCPMEHLSIPGTVMVTVHWTMLFASTTMRLSGCCGRLEPTWCCPQHAWAWCSAGEAALNRI